MTRAIRTIREDMGDSAAASAERLLRGAGELQATWISVLLAASNRVWDGDPPTLEWGIPSAESQPLHEAIRNVLNRWSAIQDRISEIDAEPPTDPWDQLVYAESDPDSSPLLPVLDSASVEILREFDDSMRGIVGAKGADAVRRHLTADAETMGFNVIGIPFPTS